MLKGKLEEHHRKNKLLVINKVDKSKDLGSRIQGKRMLEKTVVEKKREKAR